MLIILILLILFSYGGGIYSEPFRGPGLGLGTVLLVLLIWLALSGRLH